MTRVAILVGAVLVVGDRVAAQTPNAGAPTIACVDSSVSGVIGTTPCTIFARHTVTAFPSAAVMWIVETFPSRAAAERVRTPTGAVVESEGETWLLTVGADRPTPSGGTRLATIGPLPLPPAKGYEIMLAHVSVPPGSQSAVHVQSGPEAWYVLSGSQCVETPKTVQHIDKGHSGIVAADTPLYLMATGTTTRSAFFVIVHDTARPFYTEINSWTPTGACRSP